LSLFAYSTGGRGKTVRGYTWKRDDLACSHN
jgi:hypothetical protein